MQLVHDTRRLSYLLFESGAMCTRPGLVPGPASQTEYSNIGSDSEKRLICVPPSSNGDVLEPDDKHKTV
jgi:hypothetical protein